MNGQKRVYCSQTCRTVTEKRPLQIPSGLISMADRWGATPMSAAGRKIKTGGSVLAWDSGEKKDCLA